MEGQTFFRELEQQDVAPAASREGFTAFPEERLTLQPTLATDTKQRHSWLLNFTP
jgi:hypothetical protein